MLPAGTRAVEHRIKAAVCAGAPTAAWLRRKFERFFEHFHEYDNIVVATFPTCHDPTLRELLRLGLPQRYIALVRCATECPQPAHVAHAYAV